MILYLLTGLILVIANDIFLFLTRKNTRMIVRVAATHVAIPNKIASNTTVN